MHRRSALVLIFILVAFVISVVPLRATTFWVATNGNDANPGTQLNPLRNIQFAINQTYQTPGGDTIFVKAGTYHERLFITAGPIALISESGAASTIVDADSLGDCLQFYYGIGTSALVDGFTFTDGFPHGIYIPGTLGLSSDPEIRYCHIIGNGSPTSFTPGAGIRTEFNRPNIHHNIIKGNSTTASGAGIDGVGASPQIWNNEIDSNWSVNGQGAGINLLANYEIRGPSVVFVPAYIQNNIIRWNRSGLDGAGIFLDSNNIARVFNNLFYYGTANSGNTGYSGGGLAFASGAVPLVQNNTFVGNSPYPMDCNFSLVADSVFNNCFYLNTPDDVPGGNCNADASNLNVNPQFIDEANGNYRLPISSPLIDAGLWAPGLAFVDFDGSGRWNGVNPDIGPFENCLLIPDFTWDPDTACAGELIQTDFLISGSWNATIWEWGDGDVDTVYIVEEFAPTKAYAIAGSYNITMTAMCESDTQSITKPITILGKPVAELIASDTVGCVGASLSFNPGPIDANYAYLWQFGDGITSTLPDPSHTYNLTGNFLVRLIATNSCGPDTATLLISIQDVPDASFTTNATSGSAPLPIIFNGSSTQPTTGWQWTFGDGGTSSAEDTTYTYEQPGIYSVSLAASNDCGSGLADTRPNYIRVSGFDLQLVSADTLTNNFRKVFSIETDTIFGLYNRLVNLSATILPANPRRGNATVTLSKSQVAVPEEFTATVSMDSVLAKGVYQLRIIGTSTANLPVDTIFLNFTSNPFAIASITPTLLDFGMVQLDEPKTDTVFVRNQLTFPLTLSLAVLDVTSGDPAFVPLVTSTTTSILPGNTFKIPVRFSPTELRQYSTTLQLQTNDPVSEFFTINMTGTGIPEQKPPRVIATAPMTGATGVLIGSTISLEVSEPLNPATVLGAPLPFTVRAILRNQLVAGTFEYQGGTTQLSFVSSAKLPSYDTILVRLEGTVEDLAGNSLDSDNDSLGEGSPVDDFQFKFFTGPAVYPGDCNNDGRVNELDVLPLGIFFGLEGPRRNLFGEGNDFGPKQALEWPDPRATFADANGDGFVDVSDLLIISTNWDLVHASRRPLDYTDIKLPDFADGFRQLRPALSSFAGSERGDRMLELVTSLASNVVLPEDFSLLQNFPNPFNPQTSITYGLPVGANVRVSIHNILGQTVRILIDSYEEAGFKNVMWDGCDQNGRPVSSGLYFYRLEAGDFVSVRKMMKLQ